MPSLPEDAAASSSEDDSISFQRCPSSSSVVSRGDDTTDNNNNATDMADARRMIRAARAGMTARYATFKGTQNPLRSAPRRVNCLSAREFSQAVSVMQDGREQSFHGRVNCLPPEEFAAAVSDFWAVPSFTSEQSDSDGDYSTSDSV
ncbi:unnamed protein product [Polarella glacialis]|uniref:Uncharacterized protein n=1 Tax=Polarella glacialis TaxID=89957 RepID=A0A813L7M1_POLGL|nr:unnamed protein product [Polarella glacialis]